MQEDTEFNRTCWHSRRGMLELDLVLEPFVRDCYRTLPPIEQEHYRRLLDCEDQDLYSWFLGRVGPGDEELASIVDKILAFARGKA